jgi:undecaprenyl pyrophosphate phosphatase UppP
MPRHERDQKEIITMNILIAIIAIIAVALLFTGGFVPSLNFLLWVGIVLAVIAVIVWLVGYLGGRSRV